MLIGRRFLFQFTLRKDFIIINRSAGFGPVFGPYLKADADAAPLDYRDVLMTRGRGVSVGQSLSMRRTLPDQLAVRAQATR